MSKGKRRKQTPQKDTRSAEAIAGDPGSAIASATHADHGIAPARRRWWTVVGGFAAFLATVVGIWAITGYTLRDFVNSAQPLGFGIGDVDVNEGQECAVVFVLQPTGDDYPRVLGLPISVMNRSETTARHVGVLIKCSAPLRVWPQELSKSEALGSLDGMKRVTARVDSVSSSSWTIDRLAPGQAVMFVDALMWEKDVWKIDSPLTIDISITVDDRPSRTHTLKLWSTMALGPIPDGPIAISKDAQLADCGLIVYFENYLLMKAKGDFETPFYSFQSMSDVKFAALKTHK